MLAPQQTRRTSETWQINQFNLASGVHDRHRRALMTARPFPAALNEHPQTTIVLDNAEHDDLGQANKDFTDASRVNFHRGSQFWRRREPPEFQSPCLAPGMLRPPSFPKRPFNSCEYGLAG